jgi:uncharacterized protein YndB with AHSA1/START domain
MTYDLKFERVIDARPNVVFDAFVDPETQSSLYDNREEPDWIVESEIDLRVGGTWTITFGKSGETAFRETNVFTHVDRPHRLVFDSNMFGGPYGTTFDTKVTVTFEEQDGKTLLTIVQTRFEKREERDMIEDGWPSILDALESVVAQKTGQGSS